MKPQKSFRKILGAGALSLSAMTNIVGVANAAQVTDYLQVTLTIVGSCTVNGGTLDFGQLSELTTAHDAESTFTVKCTNTLPYDIALGAGLHSQGNQRRLERNGSYLNYDLYSDGARTQAWGDTWNTNTKSGIGSGADQTHSVYGQLPAQSLPTFGQFNDTVLITVKY